MALPDLSGASAAAGGGGAPSAPTAEELDRIVAIWSRVVGTQEHFNDICMRVRALYATFIGVLVGAYGFLLDKAKEDFSVGGFQMDAIIPLAVAGYLVSSLFYFVDRYWYHALLQGAVDQGREIETRWGRLLPEIKLGEKISNRSPVDLSGKPFKLWLTRIAIRDARLRTSGKLHSDAKIELFYKPLGRIMLLTALLAGLFGGIRHDGRSFADAMGYGASSASANSSQARADRPKADAPPLKPQPSAGPHRAGHRDD